MEVPSSPSPRNARSTRDYDDDDLTGPNFVDHFSLRHPSSTVKFRGARVHVYEFGNEQILLEDRQSRRDSRVARDAASADDDDNAKSRRQYRHTITVKRMDWGSFGLRVLRLAYLLISLLIFGFLFAICFQIILFLFFNLLTSSGLSSEDGDTNDLVITGTLLSVPVFLFGLSSLMAIASTFVGDSWSGGYLIRAVFGFPVVITDMLYFVFFLLVPALTFIVALFEQGNSPWEITCGAWFVSTGFVFGCFGLAIVWCEISACFQLISIHYCNTDEDSGDAPSWKMMMLKVRRAILLTQTQKYSGEKKHEYLVSGNDLPPDGGYSFSEEHEPMQVKRSLYTRVTQLACLRFMYDTVDPTKRIYSIEEVRDVLPFLTKHNWSLESYFCTSGRERSILSAGGPSALSRGQIMSSAVCNIFGTLIIILFFIGVLVWMSSGWGAYILAAILCFVCCLLPLIRSNNAVVKLYSDINQDNPIEEGDEEKLDGDGTLDNEVADIRHTSSGEENTMFRLFETLRVSKPKSWVCFTGLLFEFLLLFLIPVTVLFYTGNTPVGVIFLILSIFSFLRKYFNAAAILCELGSMDNIDVEKEPGKEHKASPFAKSLKGADRTLVLKSRLADVVGNISRSRSVVRWMWFFGVLVVLTFVGFSAASTADDGLGERPPIILVDDYYYPGEKSLQYPTCSMSKGFQISVDGENHDSALADYSFLSALAYEVPNVTKYLLPQWFGEGMAIDQNEAVKQYRADSGTAENPIYFKLFTFPAASNLAVVAIRGSQTNLDWMVNMQLWSAAGLAQLVKWLTPYGWIWTPILDKLVAFVNFVQSDSVKKVSYYTVTTDFVNQFRNQYDSLRVTGASLGGGLAIITGAQSRVPAIAISGLGAELSRHTLNPPITKEQINEWVFNWIPDRDYIARLGGRPRQHQEAQCSAPTSDLFGCHSMWRSVCEINYRCGTNGRPVFCRCVFNFDYPEPEPVGTSNRTFKEACYEQEQAFLNATGSSVTSGWDYS